MWRWSYYFRYALQRHYVFSTYVEVILNMNSSRNTVFGILHVCGGDPVPVGFKTLIASYSPRMWRWSSKLIRNCLIFFVFSTYVEVILISGTETADFSSILHVCGGDPVQGVREVNIVEYSPRMWRWSQLRLPPHYRYQVFSTYVEVILCRWWWCQMVWTYSPRMWRWSYLRLMVP